MPNKRVGQNKRVDGKYCSCLQLKNACLVGEFLNLLGENGILLP